MGHKIVFCVCRYSLNIFLQEFRDSRAIHTSVTMPRYEAGRYAESQ